MIKKINPIIPIALSALFLIIMFITTQVRKNNIETKNMDLALFESKAKYLYELKSRWSGKNLISKLNSSIPNQELKQNTQIKKSGNKIIMTVDGIDKHSINTIVKNIFSQNFEIKKFRLDGKENMSLRVEIRI